MPQHRSFYKAAITDAEKAHARADIARRYAWSAECSPVRKKPSISTLRLSEVERLFRSRWGNTLPNNKPGWNALVFAAHTIAGMRGEVVKHIVAWASLWAPWLSTKRATALAGRIAAHPLRFKADTAAWRLQITMAERAALGITTMGAIGTNKEQRAADKRKRQAAAARVRRAAKSTGRPRGRPKKGIRLNASSAGIKKDTERAIADDAFFASQEGRPTQDGDLGSSPVPQQAPASRMDGHAHDGIVSIEAPPIATGTTPAEAKKVERVAPATARRPKSSKPCADRMHEGGGGNVIRFPDRRHDQHSDRPRVVAMTIAEMERMSEARR